MKKILAVIIGIIIVFCAMGCANEVEESGDFSFIDDLGRRVSVESPERVAALLGSFADMWILAGGEVCATADDAWDDFGLDLADDVVNLGSTHRPNREELILSEPDMVLASAKLSKHLEMQESLEGMGIAVAYFDVGDFDDYLRVFKIMTDLTSEPGRYTQYGTNQQKDISNIIQSHKNEKEQTVLVMRASAASIRAKNSEDTMLGGMLSDFRCKNIADSDRMLLDNLSVESILLQNPDKIFFVETGDDSETVKLAVEDMFSKNPLWYELDAVKNGKVYFMEKNLYNLKPNARFAEAYEKLGKILYEK